MDEAIPLTHPVGQWWKLSSIQCLQAGDSGPWGEVSHLPEVWGWPETCQKPPKLWTGLPEYKMVPEQTSTRSCVRPSVTSPILPGGREPPRQASES